MSKVLQESLVFEFPGIFLLCLVDEHTPIYDNDNIEFCCGIMVLYSFNKMLIGQ